MAHLLMIESFIGGNAVLLPKLLKQLGHTYTFITRSKGIFKSSFHSNEHVVIQHADEIIEANTNDASVVLDTILGKKFDGVITTCDYYIETVVEVAKELSIPCPFPKAVKNVRYKQKLRQTLDAAGISNPQYGLAYNWDEVLLVAKNIGYPVVLKPVDLSSSAYVRLIRSEEDLRDAYHQLNAFPINWRDQERDCTYLLEKYMEGNEVSVEAVTFNGETTIIGITQKSLMGAPYFIEDAHMFPANISHDMKLKISGYVVKALQAAGYDYGVSHTEVKLTDAGPRIVEINPRVAGDYIAEIIKLVCNVDILRAFVDLSIGIEPSITKKETGISSACVRFLTPHRGGKIVNIVGVDTLASDSHIDSFKVEDCIGKTVGDPIDNAGRIGWIITKDTEGYNAMNYAYEAMEHIKLTFE
ncbi:conserved hypothetical protein [Alkaliphilus metalliredigens QYMF]|uniref:ATP-grasp domain-containing protein n=1 Tax=Alkaliphilus metalliredigens (strain QYMF) TaxID=293826 RepID=A6TPU8_ALKMQ|nr:ATP-grasp domain-containing protein [Alkaliphilus metalliredigens]ABR48216.1 conserved hypothetical protein [Alkaliphilus metalliredigens QYMF]